MTTLFGQPWSRRQLLPFVGNLSQVAGIRRVRLDDGIGRDVRVAEFNTGSGLRFDVIIDRGLDLGAADYRGIPLAWVSPVGIAHPAFFDPHGKGWNRIFGGGLLAGCGLRNAGSPNIDDGEELGQHGRLSTTPASDVQTGQDWDGDQWVLWLKGQVREANTAAENLLLTRRISAPVGQSSITIHDVVENCGDTSSPLMILYHCNFGFPLVSPDSHLIAAPHPIRARDPQSASGIGDWDRCEAPTPGCVPIVLYHDLPADDEGWCEVQLANPRLGLQLTLRFLKAGLPNLVQWKSMRAGMYVLGLEPANCLPEGRSAERSRGTLQFIAPGERREFSLQIQVEEMR